jgi:hypothetical protein
VATQEEGAGNNGNKERLQGLEPAWRNSGSNSTAADARACCVSYQQQETPR